MSEEPLLHFQFHSLNPFAPWWHVKDMSVATDVRQKHHESLVTSEAIKLCGLSGHEMVYKRGGKNHPRICLFILSFVKYFIVSQLFRPLKIFI